VLDLVLKVAMQLLGDDFEQTARAGAVACVGDWSCACCRRLVGLLVASD